MLCESTSSLTTPNRPDCYGKALNIMAKVAELAELAELADLAEMASGKN